MSSVSVFYFKMDGCGFCQMFEPILNLVKKQYATSGTSPRFQYIESNQIPTFMSSHPFLKPHLTTVGKEGFPDLRMIVTSSSGKISAFKFTGNRTVDDVVHWINTHSSRDTNKKRRTRKSTRHISGGKRRRHRRVGTRINKTRRLR